MVDLVGRTDAIAAIDSVLYTQAAEQRALIIRGDAGVGKTTLINHVAARARHEGVHTFRCVGVETEVGVQLAGLHQLLRPMRAKFPVPPQQAAVLDRAFEAGDTPPVVPFELANAVLELAETAGLQSRVLLLVDDVQWLDESSSNVLAFVSRRIANGNVSVLIGHRPLNSGPWERSDIPSLELRPLSGEEAESLLDSLPEAPVGLDRRRVLIEAEGNPLALVELPRALKLAHGSAHLAPDKLPLSRRLELVFASKVKELTRQQQELVLLSALDRTGAISTIREAAGTKWWLPDMMAASDLGILHIHEDHVRFDHPLVRSAAVQMASSDDVRASHAALATALRDAPELWAWHRAAAASDPDNEVADALERIARESLQKGGSQSALRAILRAAELTPHHPTRARRLAYAAHLANQTGQLMLARETVAQLRQAQPPTNDDDDEAAATDGYINVVLAYALLNWEGDTTAAFQLLVRALNTASDASQPWIAEMLNSLLLVCVRTSRAEHWEELNKILTTMGDAAPLEVVLSRDALSDPARTAHGVAARLNQISPTILELEPWRAAWTGMASVYIDNLPAQRHILRKIIEQEEIGGSIPSYWIAVVLAALDAMVSGQWQESNRLAKHGLKGSEQFGFAEIANDFRTIIAMLAAMAGDHDVVSRELAAVEAWARPRGGGLSEAWIQHIMMRVFESEGHYEEEYAAALRVSPNGVLAPFRPHALWMFGDTVTAAWNAGHHEKAREYVRAGEDARLDLISPRLAFHLALARAVVSDPDGKRELFELALQSAGIESWPFDHARAELAFGEWLRRNSDAVEARAHLRVAADIFNHLGAVPWSDRATNALRATRIEPAAATDTGLSRPLTPQESQIAALAAKGLSNKEIGSRLSLSPRTVSGHLYNIYPKLGIASRAALHEALSRRTDHFNGDA